MQEQFSQVCSSFQLFWCSPLTSFAGDSKSTGQKLTDDTSSNLGTAQGKLSSAGQNVKETASNQYQGSGLDNAQEKLSSAGQNVKETASNQTQGTSFEDAQKKVADATQNIKDTANSQLEGSSFEGAAKNVQDTASNLTQQATDNAGAAQESSKGYLEQAQSMAANALNSASKTASGM